MQELPLDKIVRAAPYDPIYGESLLDLRAGAADQRPRPALRPDPAQRQRRRLRPGRAAAGSEAALRRAQMNLRAAALGLADTHYANPIGLDERGNYSSAADLATLTRRLLRDPAFARIADARAAPRCAACARRGGSRRSTNCSASRPGSTGVKTGHTFDAGYVLVGSGRRKGVDLISVVIGAPTEEARDGDSLELLEYGFSPVPAAGADPRRPGPRRRRRSATPAASCRCGRRAASPPASAAASGSSVEVEAPGRGRGADRARRRRSAARRSSSTAARPARRRCAPAGRSPKASALRPGPRASSSDHPILTAVALFVILIGAALLWRAVMAPRGPGR